MKKYARSQILIPFWVDKYLRKRDVNVCEFIRRAIFKSMLTDDFDGSTDDLEFEARKKIEQALAKVKQ